MRQLKITNHITDRDCRSLERYLLEISRENMIDADQEVQLAQRIRKGDEIAKAKLVKANLRFVVSVAKQYQHHGLSLSDLINEGNVGLIKAAEKFDETRGFKFISYAVWWIRQSIMQAVTKQGRMIKVPSNKAMDYNNIHKSIQTYIQTHGHQPSIQDLVDEFGFREIDVKDYLANHKRHLSTDAPLGEGDEGRVIDTIKSDVFETPDNSLLTDSMRRELNDVLSILSERDINIISCYFGLGNNTTMTLEDIGDRFGLTRERVRQIKEKCLRKIREHADVHQLKTYMD